MSSLNSIWAYSGMIFISVLTSVIFFFIWKFRNRIHCCVCCYIDEPHIFYEEMENEEEEEEEGSFEYSDESEDTLRWWDKSDIEQEEEEQSSDSTELSYSNV